MEKNLNFLSTRSGFNIALRHFKFVNKLIKNFEKGGNLADMINEALENKLIEQHQFAPILNALLIDKYSYHAESMNIKTTFCGELSSIASIVESWDKFDIVMSYFHPQLGQTLINPKSKESLENVDHLKENEMVVIYVGNYNEDFDLELAKKACAALKSIINGEKVSNVKLFKSESSSKQPEIKKVEKVEEIKKVEVKIEKKVETKQPTQPQKETPQQQPVSTSSAKKKLSPHYGVIVSNELFHNGNVEAWKKIIASYEGKYPDTKILVFYEGEQIQDINTLFKWGKVKHGTNIYFALLGQEFRDISKLRRYLAQGASNRFEDFLKGDPTKTLSLF
ncbi:MAG TPA: hypothetical protein PK771_11140 [Spirochaetota bacterium]|nr:hypothetical protein [Spirochaetota bacterium]